MISPLSVFVEDAATAQLDPVIASLPRSFRRAARSSDAEVHVIAGSTGWSDRAAATAGSAAVFVFDPVAETVPVEWLHRSPRAPLLLGTAWRHAAAVDDAAAAIADLLRPNSLLEGRVIAATGSDTESLLLAQLGLLRSIGLPARRLDRMVSDERGHEAIADVGDGVRVALSAVLSDAAVADARLSLVDAAGSVSLVIPSEQTARPSSCVIEDASGIRRMAAPFESTLRTAMRHLHRLALEGAPHSELAGFAEDVAVLRARTVLSAVPATPSRER